MQTTAWTLYRMNHISFPFPLINDLVFTVKRKKKNQGHFNCPEKSFLLYNSQVPQKVSEQKSDRALLRSK